MKLRYTDRARDDLDLAFAWYERQRRGLGFDFLDCVEEAVKSILENPKMYRLFRVPGLCHQEISIFSVLHNRG